MAKKRSSKYRHQTVLAPHKHSPVVVLAMMAILVFMKCSADNHEKRKKEMVRQCTYSFQHRLLPSWTHDSDGQFYRDIIKHPASVVQDAAREIVGRECADAILVELVGEPEGILLTFQPPEDSGDCFYAFLALVDNGFRYMTLEKAREDFGLGYKSFLCEWTPDEAHLNYGGRLYDDKAGFAP